VRLIVLETKAHLRNQCSIGGVIRSFHMPGDPTEYREHAKECMRWAVASRSTDGRERFEKLAEFWMQLAFELEGLKPSWMNRSYLGTSSATRTSFMNELKANPSSGLLK
jgi:hypothetical protein